MGRSDREEKLGRIASNSKPILPALSLGHDALEGAVILKGAGLRGRFFALNNQKAAASGTQSLSLRSNLMDNKRGTPRKRALKSGKIIYAGGSFSIDCIIRDLSDTGARLQVPTTVTIPDSFILVDAHAGVRRAATVVWRRGDRMGVRFD